MVSIKDIAKKCNVSVATVSKALNNQKDISDATKKKVKKIAEQMGYTTNVAARALKTNKTYNIGVLFDDSRSGLTHEYFSLILSSFQKEVESKGYDLTFINNTVAGKKTTYLNHIKYRNFDGIIIMIADYNSENIKELLSSNIPIVTIDYMCDKCSSVLSDNSKGLEELVKYAYSMGHRKIAYIHGEYTEVTRDRLSSFARACKELNLDIPSSYVVESLYHDIATCSKKTKELLSLNDRPTCIIFSDDYSLLGGRDMLINSGLSIPKDISIIGYDGINMAKIFNLTTYEQDTDTIGIKAAEKLLLLIEKPDSKPEHVIVPGRLIKGNTVKKIK